MYLHAYVRHQNVVFGYRSLTRVSKLIILTAKRGGEGDSLLPDPPPPPPPPGPCYGWTLCLLVEMKLTKDKCSIYDLTGIIFVMQTKNARQINTFGCNTTFLGHLLSPISPVRVLCLFVVSHCFVPPTLAILWHPIWVLFILSVHEK